MSWKKRRSRKPIDLDSAKLRMTDAIKEAERIIMNGDSDNQKIQAMNALSGLISRYAKLVEVTDMEKRLQRLEEQSKMRKVS